MRPNLLDIQIGIRFEIVPLCGERERRKKIPSNVVIPRPAERAE